jgi:hypothetical protein
LCCWETKIEESEWCIGARKRRRNNLNSWDEDVDEAQGTRDKRQEIWNEGTKKESKRKSSSL